MMVYIIQIFSQWWYQDSTSAVSPRRHHTICQLYKRVWWGSYKQALVTPLSQTQGAPIYLRVKLR